MERIVSPAGATISYDQRGDGPPLVLVHGSFTDHHTNWELVKPRFAQRFTVYAIARRGRGETDATEGHRVEDEARDVAALIESIGDPVFLLAHSYGAQPTLAAAANMPDRVRKLIVYEPPWPGIITPEGLAQLEALAKTGDWDGFTATFFRDVIRVPAEEVDAWRGTELWRPIVSDAKASLGDIRALSRYDFEPERFRELRLPVMLQIGTRSPRHLYVTDALAEVLPDARIEALPGQAHEGMMTAPQLYTESVARFFHAEHRAY